MKHLLLFLLLLAFAIPSKSEQKQLNKEDLNKLVKSHFLTGDLPLRYVSNILVRIDGNPSKQDSTIIQELVRKLNKEINIYEVCLVNTVTANLEIKISHQEKINDLLPKIEIRKRDNEIIKNTVFINIPPKSSHFDTKKLIHYYILRSLISYKHHSELLQDIPGSVFAEYSPKNITFEEVDYQILKNVYSKNYDRRLRTNKNDSKKANSTKIYRSRELYIISRIVGLLLCVILVYFLLQKGFFKSHNYQFTTYIKQGLLVFLIVNLFLIFYSSVTFYLYTIILKQKTNFLPPIHHLIVGSLLIGVMSIVSAYFLEQKLLHNKRNHFIQVFFPVISTFILPSAFMVILYRLYSFFYKPDSMVDIASIFMPAISILFSITTLRVLYIFLEIRSNNLIKQKDVELAKLGELHKQAELQSLRSKINPHFLYNSLNSIASLSTVNGAKAEEMALALSDFFKYSINREQKQFNSLQEELNAIRTYLKIEKVRFGERLHFEITCPEELLKFKIPQFLIQPLVENAIKHGLSKITKIGIIKIVVQQTNTKLNIKIYDNGPDFPKGPISGLGIRNTSERLALIYGPKASLKWNNDKEKSMELILPIS